MLRRLIEKPRADVTDYESARQVGWAFRTIDRRASRTRPSPANLGNKALDTLDKNQPRIQAVLKGLDTDLILSLRDRTGVALGACPPPDQLMWYPEKADQKPIIGTLLESRLKKVADYDSEGNPAAILSSWSSSRAHPDLVSATDEHANRQHRGILA